MSFIDLCILHFAFESPSKFSLRILWKMVLLVVCDFQNGGKSRTLQNVSISFLLFYNNTGTCIMNECFTDAIFDVSVKVGIAERGGWRADREGRQNCGQGM